MKRSFLLFLSLFFVFTSIIPAFAGTDVNGNTLDIQIVDRPPSSWVKHPFTLGFTGSSPSISGSGNTEITDSSRIFSFTVDSNSEPISSLIVRYKKGSNYIEGADMQSQLKVYDGSTEVSFSASPSTAIFNTLTPVQKITFAYPVVAPKIEILGPTLADTVVSIAIESANTEEIPEFTLDQAAGEVTSSSTTVDFTGQVTKMAAGAVIETRINNGTWSDSYGSVSGFGEIDLKIPNSSFPDKSNTLDIRIKASNGLYSATNTINVSNNVTGGNPNPGPNPNPNPNPGGGGSGSGILNLDFDVPGMFSSANMVVAGFMGLLTIVIGIAIGFRVVRFVKDLF